MAGNSVTGSSHEMRTLDYFDRLPKSVRAVVANAALDYALRGWLQMFERGQISAKDLAKRVRLHDRNTVAKQRLKIWGADYPRLKGELRP
jgi:hypothetical protein